MKPGAVASCFAKFGTFHDPMDLLTSLSFFFFLICVPISEIIYGLEIFLPKIYILDFISSNLNAIIACFMINLFSPKK